MFTYQSLLKTIHEVDHFIYIDSHHLISCVNWTKIIVCSNIKGEAYSRHSIITNTSLEAAAELLKRILHFMMIKAFLFCCVAASLSAINAVDVIEVALANFKILDADKDGIITFAEFKTNAPKVCKHRVPETDREWEVLFDVIDISDNLQVDPREYVISDTIYSEFNKYDTDNNGLLSKSELLQTIDINDAKLEKNKVTFLEYFARVFTDEKLVSNWRDNVGKV